MSSRLKLILGGGLLATLLVVLAIQVGIFTPAISPQAEAPTRSAAVVGDRVVGARDTGKISALPMENSVRTAVEDLSEESVDDSVLSGLVLDHLGAPLSGALVRAVTHEKTDYSVLDIDYGRQTREVGKVITDAEGQFRLPVSANRPLDLKLSERRHGLAVMRAYGGENVVVKMTLGSVLEGRVTSAVDNLPIEGIWVRGWFQARGGSVHQVDVHTDRLGSYRFEGLPPGRITLAVEPEDLMSPGWDDVDLEPGLVVRRDYSLGRGVTISGRVTDANTGEPIAGAEIGPGWTLRRSVRTDNDGRYALRGFGGPGVSDIHVRATGYGRASHEFGRRVPLEDVGRNFALKPGRAATGRVVGPDGAAMAGVYVGSVGVSGQSGEWEGTRSGPDGKFRLVSLVPTARHQLFVQAENYGTQLIDFPPDEASRLSISFGDVRLPKAAHIAGHVVDEDGHLRPGVRVLLRGRHDGAGRLCPEGIAGLSHHLTRARESHTDSLGRFHFTDLAPGTYSALASIQSSQQAAEQTVTVLEGMTHGALVLTLPVGLSIRGQVVTTQGVPCHGVSISVQPANKRGRQANTKTDLGGWFVVAGLTEQPYVVRARPWLFNAKNPDAQLFAHSVTAPGGTDGLLIQLPRTVELQGVVRTGSGEAVTNIVVLANNSSSGPRVSPARTDEQGRFTMRVPENQIVDLETREARDLDGDSIAYFGPSNRTVTKLGVEPGPAVVVLIVPD